MSEFWLGLLGAVIGGAFSTAGSLLQARATYGAVVRQVTTQHELDRRLRREDEIRGAATTLLHGLASMSARAFTLAERHAMGVLHELTTEAREIRSLVLVYEDVLDDEAVDRVLDACSLVADLPLHFESHLDRTLEKIDLAIRTLKAVKRGDPIPSA